MRILVKGKEQWNVTAVKGQGQVDTKLHLVGRSEFGIIVIISGIIVRMNEMDFPFVSFLFQGI